MKKISKKVSSFSFTVLKIGKADAIILQTKTHAVMIDCGEEDDSQEIIEKLGEKGITELDYLFITHFDKDHVGGAAEVISNIKVKNIITPDYAGNNKAYKKYVNTVEKMGLTPTRLTAVTAFAVDDVTFNVYPPQKSYYTESDNDYSLAVEVNHDKNTFLFAGDAEKERLAEMILQTGKDIDFLKVPHHGRYNEMTEEFIGHINPYYAVITCSDKNPAEQETIDVLNNIGAETYFTKDGDITVESTGTEIIITQ